MSALIAIPIRGTLPSKTRLASLFSGEERLQLVRAMLDAILDEIPAGIDVVVITRSPAFLAGLPAHVRVLEQDHALPGLNGSLHQAIRFARDHGYRDLLMLPGDLPLLREHEIDSVLLEEGQMIIVGDRDQEGTNGLRIPTTLADVFEFGMGQQSFDHHRREAQKHGLIPVTVYYQGLAHDLDSPDDWFALPENVRERLTTRLQLTVKGA